MRSSLPREPELAPSCAHDVMLGPFFPAWEAKGQLGDLNRDGKLDLVSTQSVSLGNGDGTFQRPVSTGEMPGTGLLADFNGDGSLDLAVASFEPGGVNVLFGNGDGTLRDRLELPTADGTEALATGDFNADGRADLAVASGPGKFVKVLLGTPDDGFVLSAEADYPEFAYTSISVGDFDVDGNLDFQAPGLWLGGGDGTFSQRIDPGFSTGAYPKAVDLNGDGILDLVGVHLPARGFTGALSISLGNGDGTFTSLPELESVNEPRRVMTGDVNGDGVPDLLTTGGGVNVLLGAGDGTFAEPVEYFGEEPLSIGDLDCDGDEDLVAGSVLLGNGDGTFPDQSDYAPRDDDPPDHSILRDLDEDGALDLVTLDSSNVSIRFGVRDGNFENESNYRIGASNRWSLDVTDLNDDGLGDVVIDTSPATVLLSQGERSYVRHPWGDNEQLDSSG